MLAMKWLMLTLAVVKKGKTCYACSFALTQYFALYKHVHRQKLDSTVWTTEEEDRSTDKLLLWSSHLGFLGWKSNVQGEISNWKLVTLHFKWKAP